MMKDEKYFQLIDGVYLIKGLARAAIYNTNSGDIFSIGGQAKKYLNSLLDGKKNRRTS